MSIEDIGEGAGIPYFTVSRPVSDSLVVSEETKARIQCLARGLVVRQTYSVMVVVTTIAGPNVAGIGQGIKATAHGHICAVIL